MDCMSDSPLLLSFIVLCEEVDSYLWKNLFRIKVLVSEMTKTLELALDLTNYCILILLIVRKVKNKSEDICC
jgi:hypothetical protein